MKTTILFLLVASHALAAEIHVAPGSDDNAVLERARDAARKEKGSTVILAPGTYRLTKTFTLDERDSGTTFRGENARITGSVSVSNNAVKPVADPAILERLLPEVRGKVLEIDLKKLGITDFGEIGPRGFRRPYIPAPLELIVDDEPQMLARWPNPGTPGVPMGKVFDRGAVTRTGEKPDRGGIFALTRDRPERWTQADDVWITGSFAVGYADDTVKVKKFDLEQKTITTVQPHMYGFKSGRWTALNVLEEIDVPGEFMADKKTGKLYFLPPKSVVASVPDAGLRLEVSVLKSPLIAIEGATNVVFDGINIENSRGMGVYIERGGSNRIQNSTLRNLGMVAICIGKGVSPDPLYRHGFTGTPISRALGSWHEHIYENINFNREAGTGHGVVNCHIYNIGAGAISLGGGDRLKLIPAGNFVENCRIHQFNRWDRSYKGAVNIDGVGNRIAHCEMYDAPGSAIYLHGNEHVIEYNVIRDVVKGAADMGAFYMGRDPTERGNAIRYNYWRDAGWGGERFCLYFDDSGGDASTVYGNVFQRSGSMATVFIPGGSDFVVKNNLFVDCKRPIWVRAFRAGTTGIFKERMASVKYDQPPWSERYPQLLTYWQSKRPRNNVIEDNLIVPSDDPRLVIGKDGRVTLQPDADLGLPGFKPIPFDKIGVQK